ncbi:MAG: winged helix-turn-helix transcriptional regulator [Caldisericia bacterium]|nr:winged helix-turn-helix transcriptional regulator [Caldisericia bacterium]
MQTKYECNFNPPNFEELEKTAEIFSALSHPKRLQIIKIISEKPQSVTTISGKMGCEPPCTSQHLRILKSAGIVGSKRVGREVLYSLKMNCILTSINCICERCELK